MQNSEKEQFGILISQTSLMYQYILNNVPLAFKLISVSRNYNFLVLNTPTLLWLIMAYAAILQSFKKSHGFDEFLLVVKIVFPF